ncbi:hypothetical protein [Streptomyces sp. NPDC018693]|uniref:hypothetical protein n=1 Tax=unclassified Streptomyces TaxID=2593676 RepID=UPI0037908728
MAKKINGTVGVMDVMLFCLALIAQDCPDHLLDEQQQSNLDRLFPTPSESPVSALESAGAAATYFGRIPTHVDIERAEQQFAAIGKIREVVQRVLTLEREGSHHRGASRDALIDVHNQAEVAGVVVAVTTRALHSLFLGRCPRHVGCAELPPRSVIPSSLGLWIGSRRPWWERPEAHRWRLSTSSRPSSGTARCRGTSSQTRSTRPHAELTCGPMKSTCPHPAGRRIGSLACCGCSSAEP